MSKFSKIIGVQKDKSLCWGTSTAPLIFTDKLVEASVIDLWLFELNANLNKIN